MVEFVRICVFPTGMWIGVKIQSRDLHIFHRHSGCTYIDVENIVSRENGTRNSRWRLSCLSRQKRLCKMRAPATPRVRLDKREGFVKRNHHAVLLLPNSSSSDVFFFLLVFSVDRVPARTYQARSATPWSRRCASNRNRLVRKKRNCLHRRSRRKQAQG